jgi:SagB-type dehydrogenase family enzyme
MTTGSGTADANQPAFDDLHDLLDLADTPVVTMKAPRPGRRGAEMFADEPNRADDVTLPIVDLASERDLSTLHRVLSRRRTSRLFGAEPLALDHVAALLQLSLRARATRAQYGFGGFPRRVVPSAGGIESIEAYLLARHVHGLPPGIYRYRPCTHGLATVSTTGSIRLAIARLCPFTSWVDDAPVLVALIGRLDRLAWKYGPPSYRLVHLDAGIVLQTLYVVGTALGLATGAAAGFDWRAANDRLHLDPIRELMVAAIAIGQPAGPREHWTDPDGS